MKDVGSPNLLGEEACRACSAANYWRSSLVRGKMGGVDARLEALKANPWSDQPRFYPPGQHPAYHRMRKQRRMAENLRADHRQSKRGFDELTRFIDYLDQQLAMYEERESEIKADYAAMLDV